MSADEMCGDYPAPCNCDDPETHDGAVTDNARAADWIDNLERKAKAATPGPWSADGYGSGQQVTGATGTIFADTFALPENAKFIAAANPAAILRLIGEVRRWKAAWEMASPLLTERDALAARLAAVEALHRVDPNSGHNPDCPCGRPAYDGQRCSHCRLPWPCPTSAALAAPTDTTKEN